VAPARGKLISQWISAAGLVVDANDYRRTPRVQKQLVLNGDSDSVVIDTGRGVISHFGSQLRHAVARPKSTDRRFPFELNREVAIRAPQDGIASLNVANRWLVSDITPPFGINKNAD
jgi:hypothetical protein